ncbi:hypothetical protein ACJ73_06598 [Blastomyces percursus]|uniref:Uncharacterized protein n=1 Tax=Blastomyces percursus TaxID=1658174 RepID=A0A1J9Q1T7_9EURO|nr:hypothetical protein ACJ73_06598 [Blastomyces percursus]
MLQSPDNPPPKTLEKPVLPDNYHSLGPEEKSQVDELHRRRALFYLYMVFNGGLNEQHLAGMRDPRVLLTQRLVARNWDHFTVELSNPFPCPISFTESEVELYYGQEPTWVQVNGLVEYWKSELQGMRNDGWVRTEAYEDAIKKNMELKQVLLNGSDTPEEERCVQEQWPFQDHEEEAN